MAEEASTLKLIMEKGPREGQTVEFRPPSTIQIGRGRGRVVRDGKLPINDAGISTGHLLIESTEAGHWVITDLGSSNGTVLNGSSLTPKIPSPLGNGDVVKIGEYTSIRVMIEVAEHGGVASRLRRNTRRGGTKANMAPISEDSEPRLGLGLGFGGELGKPVVENPRRRGRPRKVVKSEPQESVENEVYNGEEIDNVGPSGTKQGRQLSTRITRSLKKKDNSNQEAEISDQVVDKKTRGGRSRKKDLQDELLENVKNEILDEKEEEEFQKVEKNSTNKENSSAVGNGCQEVDISGQIVGKTTEEGTGRKKNLHGEPLESVEIEVLDEKGDEDCEKVEESLLNEQSEAVRGESGLDLEKTTLEEWFDHLEVYLPKQIHDETEEMILQMIQIAEQVQEFILKQKSDKEKGKLPLS